MVYNVQKILNVHNAILALCEIVVNSAQLCQEAITLEQAILQVAFKRSPGKEGTAKKFNRTAPMAIVL